MFSFKKNVLATSLIAAFTLMSSSAQAVSINDELDIGGAVRVNYGWQDYADGNGTLEFELFRADVNYKSDSGLFASAQYRWYEYMDVVHHAYMGYQFDENQKVQVGVTQVPFGVMPVASHSFWFGATYYLGLEDDYDAGIHYQYQGNGWRYDAAYFANDEYGDGSRFDRYSFDVGTTKESPYQEAGQLNLRIEKTIGDEFKSKLGASFQYSNLEYVPDGFENAAEGEDTTSITAAVHWQLDWQQWQLQTQYIHYDYDLDNSNRITLAAFAAPFEIAAKADVVTLNLSRQIDVDWGPISQLNCYNDYSQVVASGEGLDDSIQNVTGCMIAAGKFYSYVDWIAGKNMWFAGGDGIGIDNGDTAWHSRLNINVGFYF
ncbi:hypothetical protein [Shewanella sp. 4_MG-2023]|uniref:hypothetical protein n=1 Tax=Shewanella sp. 4_MG-2023 TaxID=3062652 RepID=UPI0026E16ECA|nr:hypothetical protein [Shewanella sp. 4_MG-2023]MDO6680330.1 hypothetical protein [Shewanella sp. 4_MG-2023]